MQRDCEPMVLCAPEGEQVAKEMSVWKDVRLVPDFVCVTVPDEIDYPLAKYTSFKTLAEEFKAKRSPDELACLKEAARLAEVGFRAMM